LHPDFLAAAKPQTYMIGFSPAIRFRTGAATPPAPHTPWTTGVT
jgi:hypothetical protein